MNPLQILRDNWTYLSSNLLIMFTVYCATPPTQTHYNKSPLRTGSVSLLLSDVSGVLRIGPGA